MLEASTVEIAPAPPPRVPAEVTAPARLSSADGSSLYLWLTACGLAIAGLSLLLPSTPSYDPWAWLIWGREIVHLSLHTTGGPSWKPLPVVFTTAFAPFGHAAPDLWLVIARAGALVAAAVAFKLAWRLTMKLTSARPFALLAGAIAVASLVNSRGFVSDNALGYSEGLAVALALIALDRHPDGARRQAFVAGFFAALDRPEAWLVWIPYGAYLFWKDAGARRLVVALFVLLPALWFLPELWGSGHLLRGVTRAQHPRSNSPAFSSCPFCTEFGRHAWSAVWTRVKVAALIAAAVAVPLARRRPGAGTLIAIAAAGFGWWVVIALETQAGFSGNDRYLALGAALVSIAGAVAWGWGSHSISSRVGRSRPAASPALALAALGLFVAFPPWLGRSVIHVGRTRQALAYQAELRHDLGVAVARLGGRSPILRCGSVMTEGFQVPMVAWALGVPVDRVEAPPETAAQPGPAPSVIFQARATRTSFLLPVVGAWTGVRYRLVEHVRTFRVYSTCVSRVTR